MIIKETELINVIVNTIEVDEGESYYTNLQIYTRTYDLINKNVKWTIPYNIIIFERKNSVWKLTNHNHVERYNDPYNDGDIPKIELDYQHLLREKKLKRIVF